MVDPAQVRIDVNNTLLDTGQVVRLRHYQATFSGAAYDDGYVTQSGTDQWLIANVQPVMAETAGADRKLYEQGRIRLDDRKFYFAGSVVFASGLDMTYKIGLGSPVFQEYKIVPAGIISWPISGVVVYHKVYVRELNTGSFAGEY